MKVKKSLKKLTVQFLLLSIFVSIFVFVPNEIVKADQLAEIEAEINRLTSDQSDLAIKKQQSEADLVALQARRADEEDELAWLNSRSEEVQEAYKSLKIRQDAVLAMQQASLDNLEQAKENYKAKLDQYGDRVESMFGMQQKSILELLLECDSLEGFFTSVKFMRIITDEDEAALDDLVEDKEELIELIDKTEKDIEENQAELDEIQVLLDNIESDINFQVDEIAYIDNSINEVNSQIDTYAMLEGEIQAAMAQAQANADKIRAEMEAEAERQRQAAAAAEAERQRQAEAEAARARQQAEAANQQTNVESAESAQYTQSNTVSQPAPAASSVPVAPVAPVYSGGGFAWPVPGVYTISSYFGYRSFPIGGSMYSDFHTGIDIPAPTGTPFVSPADGIVTFVGPIAVGGNAVIIDFGNGLSALGCHLSGFNASVGQVVSAGQTVGFIGSTGFSTGPHLHFEIRVNGSSVNPLNYL